MYKSFILIIIIISLLSATVYLLNKTHRVSKLNATISVTDVLSGRESGGFARAISPRKFRFPEDHGPHPAYQTEWWYYTGNLEAANGAHFGFQLTFFRNSLSSGSAPRNSPWASNQIYMAHFALTDVAAKQFYYFERFSRGANDLAGATAKPFRVWLEDWRVEATDKDVANPFPAMRIQAGEDDISIDLHLRNTRPVVLHGERGLSRKGARPGNASYYFSLTRLKARGRIKIKQQIYQVTGLAWMDREWSTSALDTSQVGWDWFSLQLDDGRDMMYYQIRRRDDQPDRFSSGSLIAHNGSVHHLTSDDVIIDVLDHWISPSGAKYPSYWKISIPKEQLVLEIKPVIPNQGLAVSVQYWEGAVWIKGTSYNKSLTGQGYVELTGYTN